VAGAQGPAWNHHCLHIEMSLAAEAAAAAAAAAAEQTRWNSE